MCDIPELGIVGPTRRRDRFMVIAIIVVSFGISFFVYSI